MPYPSSQNLSFETASKLGHLSVVNDPFIRGMLGSFERVQLDPSMPPDQGVGRLDLDGVEPLDFVIAVDGSMSTIPNTLVPQKTISYVKIAALNIRMDELQKAHAPIVNPETISALLSRYADTESTVLPLSNVRVPGKTLMESLREAIQATFQHFGGGKLYDTLRYIVSQEWDPDPPAWRADSALRPHFFCPFCGEDVRFPRSELDFSCLSCNQDLTLVDYLGLLMDVNESSNDDAVAVNLMGLLEHLTLINFLRELVTRGPKFRGRVLLLKDGPLMLRGQYSRLVDPIRGYLRYLHDEGIEYYLAGIEKTGAFTDFITEMDSWFVENQSVFVPQNQFILQRIKHSGNATTRYGEKVLYGSKVYFRPNPRNVLVLNVPNTSNAFDQYQENPTVAELLGLPRIATTLSALVSTQHQNAVMPIVAVNRIASMSFYPSNNILERFTDAYLMRSER
jgi:hypothetical protein